MNLNFRKTALLVGVCTVVGLGYTPQLFASSSTYVETAQQMKKITGTVVDAYGEPIIGANIIEAGTTNGAISDLDGNFTLDVQPDATIIVSYIGYLPQRIKITNQTRLNITLAEDSKSLDEVVVMGYGTQKKKLVTGATVQVKGDDISKLNTVNPLNALQSQTPGVNIVSTSGQPGSGFKVNIRGAGSNRSTTPLYIIDGVEGDINAISPGDIESLDVLKDAASSAIYGARAANGVILVTTKQGKVGKIMVSYDGSFGWQNVYRMPDLLDARQYMGIMDQINFNTGKDPYEWTKYMSQAQYNAYMDGSDKGTNWLEEMRNKNAFITNNSLNIAGGSEYSTFSTGVSFSQQDGILGKPCASNFKRGTVRMNSEHVLLRKGNLDIITFGQNFFYNHNQQSGINTGNQYTNDISNALRANPLIPVRNAAGDYYMYDDLKNSGGTSQNGWFDYNSYTSNPIAKMVNSQQGNNISKNYGMTLSGYLKIQPIKNLNYRGQFTYKQSSNSWRGYSPVYKINDQGDSNATNSVTQSMGTGWSWSIENTLSYRFSVLNNNNFDVLVGQAFQKSGHGMGESMSATANNLLFQDFQRAWLSNSMSTAPTAATGTPWGDGALASFFGRINYDYKEKYMASVIIRGDGSSNFARGKRWGVFPSFSAGWVVSNESWMESTSSWLDFLKIRASWGENGNCNVPNFQYLATIKFDDYGQYPYGDKNSATQGGYPNIVPNPDLTWETSRQTNIGLDMRFLRSRLGVYFDYYIKETKDLLIQPDQPATWGAPGAYINGGTVKNEGFELALSWNDMIGKDFKYGANLNLAHNKNKVTEVKNSKGYIEGTGDVLSQNTSPCYRMEVGKPIGYFYGYKTDGVIQNQTDLQNYINKNCDGNMANALQGNSLQPGDLKFVDVDGNGIIDERDKTEIGNPHPDLTLGFSLNFEYKGFDLAVTTYGAFGGQNIRSYRKFTDGQYENYTTEVYNYWHGEGTSNKYPRLIPGNSGVNFQQVSDIYIENADYFRMQNLTVGYDFKKLWKNCPFPQLRVYFTAQNLFTITGYKGMDPEIGSNGGSSDDWALGVDLGYYPTPRTYMVGVNIKF